MRLTQLHLDYWQERDVPDWASQIKHRKQKVSIHTLINVQSNNRRSSESNNLMQILKMVRRRKCTVFNKLQSIALNPCPTDSKRRVAFARKWLKRI